MPVTNQDRVGRQQCHSFHRRLSHEHAIERVLMMKRQRIQRDGVLAQDGHFAKAPIEQVTAEAAYIDEKIRPAEAVLDRDLPEADDTECEVMLPVVDQPHSCRREPLRLAQGPENEMRIEKEGTVHERPRRACGRSTSSNGTSSGTDVPEPSMVMLFGMGAATLVVRQR
eukprot:gene31763-40887_t